jgi:deoxyribodipyrimidine photo-lyase
MPKARKRGVEKIERGAIDDDVKPENDHDPRVVDPRRIRTITKKATTVRSGSKLVVYWMSRDQRAHDNWALLHAQHLAAQKGYGLAVVFSLVPKFLGATVRQYGFMLKGLKETEATLREHNISFSLLFGYAKDTIPAFVNENDVGAVVTDFSPLRVPLAWVNDVSQVLETVQVPLFQVDAHNIVPCWVASDKQEYAARTIRPKITRLLPEFLTEIPLLQRMPKTEASGGGSKRAKTEGVDWDGAMASLTIDRTVEEVGWCIAGARAGMQVLRVFCEERLKKFDAKRNDPCDTEVASNMSPYFHFGQVGASSSSFSPSSSSLILSLFSHFGQVGAQRAILDVRDYARRKSLSAASYIEEAVVRRELSDNFW